MIADGTYLVKSDGTLENYGEKWSFGFFVAEGKKGFKLEPGVDNKNAVNVTHALNPGRYVGVWTDPATGICYVDPVTHVAGRDEAEKLGREYGELAIWDAFLGEEIYL